MVDGLRQRTQVLLPQQPKIQPFHPNTAPGTAEDGNSANQNEKKKMFRLISGRTVNPEER